MEIVHLVHPQIKSDSLHFNLMFIVSFQIQLCWSTVKTTEIVPVSKYLWTALNKQMQNILNVYNLLTGVVVGIKRHNNFTKMKMQM